MRAIGPVLILIMILAVVAIGSTVSAHPLLGLGLVVAGVVVGAVLALTPKFALWERMAIVSLGGYIVLSYGFTNFGLPAGLMRIPLGYVLGFGAIVLFAFSHPESVRAFFTEEGVRWWLALVAVSLVHLVKDIPEHKAYAVRDATFVVDGAFMLLGFAWARDEPDARRFLKSVGVLYLINMCYSASYPFRESIVAASPTSGIFVEVPLLGCYTGTALHLVLGGLFFVLAWKYLPGWPRGLLVALAILQMSWSLAFQVRAAYLGLVFACLLIPLLSGFGRGVWLAGGVAAGIVGFFWFVGLAGREFVGRIGPVDPEHFTRHLRSMTLEPGTPGVESAEWRLTLAAEVLQRWSSNPAHVVVGEGFGEPLVDQRLLGGTQVRQPHNTHLTVLARLGLVGALIWVMFHFCLVQRLVRFVRAHPRGGPDHSLAVWFLITYALMMLFTTVQPWFEFSYGSIPFFVLMGFVLGLRKLAKAQASVPIGASSTESGGIQGPVVDSLGHQR